MQVGKTEKMNEQMFSKTFIERRLVTTLGVLTCQVIIAKKILIFLPWPLYAILLRRRFFGSTKPAVLHRLYRTKRATGAERAILTVVFFFESTRGIARGDSMWDRENKVRTCFQ